MVHTMPKSDPPVWLRANQLHVHVHLRVRVRSCVRVCLRPISKRWFAENPDFVEPLNDTWFFEIRRGDLKTIQELVNQG